MSKWKHDRISPIIKWVAKSYGKTMATHLLLRDPFVFGPCYSILITQKEL